MQSKRPKIVVFTGPESTGKSTLSKQISEELDALWINEYARSYVEELSRPYTFDDVMKIARFQKESYEQACLSDKSIVIFDTFLIITKVWFLEVYKNVPDWLGKFLAEVKIDLHLLCYPDIEWIADGVRENEEKRTYLFEQYQRELEKYNFTYHPIKGQGNKRYQQAINHINQIKI